MKLPELLQSLNRISANGLSRHAQPEVVIPIYQPGRLGGQFAVPVTHVNLGFDWDQGKLFLGSDESLTLLSAEEVEDIRKHVSLGQNRESHQRYVMLTNLLARIHRDGGQYVKQHGMDKAFADADAIVAELYAAPVSEAKARGVVMPDTEDFCFCGKHVSLQMISGGASNHGYLGSVTLLIDGEYVEYTRLNAAPAAPAAEAGIVEALDYQALFDAIAAATSVYANGAINISVQAFRESLAAHSAKGVV